MIFYSEEGGFGATDRQGKPLDEIYYLGIIDILTPYSVSKKLEHLFKSIQHDRTSISAVNPSQYAKRFLRFMAENILYESDADYNSKELPAIPFNYSAKEEPDVVVVEELPDDN